MSALLSIKQKEKKKEYKTYSIAELVEGDSSEDEDYQNQNNSKSNAYYHNKVKPWMYGDVPETFEDIIQLGPGKMFQEPAKFFHQTTVQLKGKEEVIDSSIPNKILVCAPSNIAIDNMLRLYIASHGLWKVSGGKWNPKIVWVGPNVADDLKKYSLESMARKQSKDSKDMDNVKREIVKNSKIVFATLSSTADRFFQNTPEVFDTVIIDECAQANELASLIPLRYGAKRLILVGDNNQLPSTVKS
jgi:hypothetical protein